MLDLPKEHLKTENECHAAWERSGAKRNECHAAWERFLRLHGPDGPPQKGPPKMPQTIIFKCFLALFWRHEEWTGAALRPSRTSATQHGSTHAVKNHQYTLGCSIFCISGICKRAPHSVAWVRSNLGARYITTIQGEFTDSPIFISLSIHTYAHTCVECVT